MSEHRSTRHRRRGLVAAAAAAVLGLGGVATAVIDPFGAAAATHPEGSGGAGPPGVTTVKQGPLSPQVSQSGTLGYADPETVYRLASGTITWLPSVGQVIKPGETLYRVENNPVVLLDGRVPAYRNLSPGISDGPDVKELNQNLVALGFDPDHQITVDDTWQDATTAAVERWQASLDQTQTGTITLGQVVFLPGAQRITKLDAALGTGGGGGTGDAGSTSFTEMSPVSVAPEFVSFDRTTTTPTTTVTTTTTTTSPTAPARTKPAKHRHPAKPSKPSHHGSPGGSSQHRRPTQGHGTPAGGSHSGTPQRTTGTHAGTHTAGKHTSGKHTAGKHTVGGMQSGGAHSASPGGQSSGGSRGSGASGPSATPVLETTSTVRQVQVQLDASEQGSVKVGDPAQITLPDGQTTPGTVTSIGAASDSASGSGSGSGASGPTIPVDLALAHPQDAGSLDQAPVQVQISGVGVKRALIVPLTALLALSGNRYAVEIVAPNGSRHLVPVTLGLLDEAAGVAQVSASRLRVGEQVVVPST